MPVPDCLDIANVLEDLAAGLRLDAPGFDDRLWLCELRDESGTHASYGLGLTEREAAADAWVGSWELGQLLDCIMGKAAPAEPA